MSAVEIINRTTVNGKNYVQIAGRDKEMWWVEGGPYTDGKAYDVDELKSLYESRKDFVKEWEAAEKEFKKEFAEHNAFIQLVERLKAAKETYGSPKWFNR